MRLINQRGRIVEVRNNQVKKLLADGWLRAPEGGGNYNPVFDSEGSPILPAKDLVDSPHVERTHLEVIII